MIIQIRGRKSNFFPSHGREHFIDVRLSSRPWLHALADPLRCCHCFCASRSTVLLMPVLTFPLSSTPASTLSSSTVVLDEEVQFLSESGIVRQNTEHLSLTEQVKVWSHTSWREIEVFKAIIQSAVMNQVVLTFTTHYWCSMLPAFDYSMWHKKTEEYLWSTILLRHWSEEHTALVQCHFYFIKQLLLSFLTAGSVPEGRLEFYLLYTM